MVLCVRGGGESWTVVVDRMNLNVRLSRRSWAENEENCEGSHKKIKHLAGAGWELLSGNADKARERERLKVDGFALGTGNWRSKTEARRWEERLTDATPVLVHYIDGSEMGSLFFFPLLRWWVGASVIKSERIRLLADSPPPSSIHLTMEMHGEKERESLDRSCLDSVLRTHKRWRSTSRRMLDSSESCCSKGWKEGGRSGDELRNPAIIRRRHFPLCRPTQKREPSCDWMSRRKASGSGWWTARDCCPPSPTSSTLHIMGPHPPSILPRRLSRILASLPYACMCARARFQPRPAGSSHRHTRYFQFALSLLIFFRLVRHPPRDVTFFKT